MDRTAWIAIAFCVLGLVLWEVYVAKQVQPHHAAAAGATPAPVSPSVAPGVSNSATPSATIIPSPTPQPAESVPEFAEKIETLRNSDVELHLTNRGGGIKEVVLLNHMAEKGEPVILNAAENIPIGTIVEQPAAPVVHEYSAASTTDGSLEFQRVTPEQVTIHKKIAFAKSSEEKDNFVIKMDVDLANGGAKPYAKPNYYVALGSAAPIHPKDYASFTRVVWCVNGRAKGVDVGWFGAGGGLFGIGAHPARPNYEDQIPGAEWAAVSNQFFTTLIAPLNAKATGIWGRRFEIKRWPDHPAFGIEGAMQMPGYQIAPGESYHARFEIYTGPKIYHRLAQLPHNEAEIMDFGMFKIVCQFLLNFMNLLHSWLHDYGLAILALTTVIKLTLWPIQNKANRSMRQMALLSPKMQELRERYKDDPTKMNQEVMKLYKQYGINPVGGCLPMMIQIPIFFGLFKMLGQAVELRNAKFLWIKDLSQPDTLAYLPVLGWRINLIPILMAASQIWLMAMTPKTGDATQRRVMMFTPLIFLFICYNFAAALALYYTTQNLFSILQFYLNKRQPMPTLEKVAPPTRRKR